MKYATASKGRKADDVLTDTTRLNNDRGSLAKQDASMA
jgi:hypothetical protein